MGCKLTSTSVNTVNAAHKGVIKIYTRKATLLRCKLTKTHYEEKLSKINISSFVNTVNATHKGVMKIYTGKQVTAKKKQKNIANSINNPCSS